MRLTGKWDPQHPETHHDIDMHVEGSALDLGAGITVNTQGCSSEFHAGLTKAYAHVTHPGFHSLYAAQHPTTKAVEYDTYRWELERRLITMGWPTRLIHRVEPGVVYVYDRSSKPLKKYRGDTYVLSPVTTDRFPHVADALLDRLITSGQRQVSAINCNFSDKRVVHAVLLSAGTDSTLTAWTLKQLDLNPLCLSVGTHEDDHDVKWARRAAQQLGLRFEFVELPSQVEDLQQLCTDTVKIIEQGDFSNVLMAMCTLSAQRLAVQLAADEDLQLAAKPQVVVWHGHFADNVLGNTPDVFGGYRKRCALLRQEPTDQGWAQYRSDDCMKLAPNSLQVARVGNALGCEWRSLWSDPAVHRWLLTLPMDVVPVSNKKALYTAALDSTDEFAEGPWGWHEKKVGYYTGSGIGKLMRSGILSEEFMRTCASNNRPG